jgi:acetyltransferase-like isoleucine patch superfamily enzyme
MKKFFKHIQELNFKSIYFNFKYLPFSQAIKMPIMISNKVYLRTMAGRIILDCPIKRGIIKIGYGDVGIFDDKKSRSIWEVSGEVVFKGKCSIGHGSKISVGKSGKLTLGDNFEITAESSIISFSEIQIGKDCLISWDALIMDTDFHKIKDENNNLLNPPKPIIIGDKVWIACRCTIMKNAVIPSGCVIGANSVLGKALEKKNSLYAGNPCRFIKENITWES